MRYVLQRLVQFLIVFFIVTFVVMVLLRLGLDKPATRPARCSAARVARSQIDADQREATTSTAATSCSTVYWLKDIVTGDFGLSVSQQPVGQHADHAAGR